MLGVARSAGTDVEFIKQPGSCELVNSMAAHQTIVGQERISEKKRVKTHVDNHLPFLWHAISTTTKATGYVEMPKMRFSDTPGNPSTVETRSKAREHHVDSLFIEHAKYP
ncbi:MAG: hypothetical protein ACTSUE_10830 [Promethearchaeota archaeon]